MSNKRNTKKKRITIKLSYLNAFKNLSPIYASLNYVNLIQNLEIVYSEISLKFNWKLLPYRINFKLTWLIIFLCTRRGQSRIFPIHEPLSWRNWWWRGIWWPWPNTRIQGTLISFASSACRWWCPISVNTACDTNKNGFWNLRNQTNWNMLILISYYYIYMLNAIA